MRSISCRILEIDLSSQEYRAIEVPLDIQRDFIGGSGLAARLLYSQLTPDLDPLSPAAPLLFLTGPLTGTSGPAVGRFVICAKSPATGLWGESNVGGFFGPELRAAGYDGLWITGEAPTPVYLWVNDGELEFRDARHLWGKTDTYQAQALIREELRAPGVRVATIGLAGESQLPFSVVLCDHGRVAGRTGMGAVMGAKRLKAVAVRGAQPLPLAEREAFSVLRGSSNRALRDDNVTRSMRELGSGAAGDYFDYLGMMPKRYFTRGTFEGAVRTTGASMAETILSGVSTCHACVIACGRKVRLSDGGERKGPEYETMVGFGPNLEISNLNRITQYGELCDRYGMDTISLSNTIGLAFLLAERGHLPKEFERGFELAWGAEDTVERLIHLTARREGIGELLALGARSLARQFNSPDLAAQVNGLEVAYHDPRGASGMALVYATSPRGACHNQSDYYAVELGQTADELGIRRFRRQDGPEKAANVARHQDWRTLWNSLVICQFANVPPSTVLGLVNTATGFEYTFDELLQVGERGWVMKRALNHRLGLRGQNDRLPGILLDPLPDGGAEGYVPPFDEMLAAYYHVREWDPTSGRPIKAKLAELNLEDLARDLWGEN